MKKIALVFALFLLHQVCFGQSFSTSGDFLINKSGVTVSSPTPSTTSANSVVSAGYGSAGGGYLIDQSSVGGKPAMSILDGSGSSTSSTSSNRSSDRVGNSSTSRRTYSDHEIKLQEERTKRAYSSYKRDPSLTGHQYYQMQQRTLDKMNRNRR